MQARARRLRDFYRHWVFMLLGVILLSCSADEQASDGDDGETSTVSQALCIEERLTVVSATASSLENANKPASAAIDGSMSTRWSSAFSDPQWIKLDLGGNRHVSRVLLKWETAASSDYEVQVSGDGTTWSSIYADHNGNGGNDNTVNLNATGRYVRIYSHHRTTQYGVSLWEIEVYGSANPSCAQPLGCLENQLGTTAATASSVEQGAFPASKAIDGNLGTRWSSAFSDPQWLKVDLGGSRHISRVMLHWETAASKHYQLQVSLDGNAWQTIHDELNGNGGVDDINGLSGVGRYLRIFSHTRTTNFGVSLWEVKIFGDTNAGCATPACDHPYIRTLPSGDVEFKVTLPSGQQYVEVFVRQNGIQNVAQNIVSSGVTNGNGTTTYRYVKGASNFAAGDQLITRFYSYKPSSPGVFTPGPAETVWSVPFTYGDCEPDCAPQPDIPIWRHTGVCTDNVLDADIGKCLNDAEAARGGSQLIDPVADAVIPQGTYATTCSMTFIVESFEYLHDGAGFQNVFGWYPAREDASGDPIAPAPSDLHVLFGCGDQPGAMVDPVFPANVSRVGYFIASNGGQCVPTSGGVLTSAPQIIAYSEEALNPCGWTQLLAWPSKASAGDAYWGFEDLTAASSQAPDFDFEDFLIFVETTNCTTSCTSTSDCAPGLVCVNSTCSVPSPQCGPSDDGDACTPEFNCFGEAKCGDGICGCITDDPNDGNECTAGSCDAEGNCVHVPVPLGAPCLQAPWCPTSQTQCTGRGTCGCVINILDSPTPDNDGNPCTSAEPTGVPDVYLHRPHAIGTLCSLASGFTCAGEQRCDGAGRCLCATDPEEPDDGNTCTDDECNGFYCFHKPRFAGTSCTDDNFCNGSCSAAGNCACADEDPVPAGAPLRVGTFNTQFLSHFLGFTGHGFEACGTDFWGDTDFECLIDLVAPKMRDSGYDVLMLNEVFSADARDLLRQELTDDGPYPHVIEELDWGGFDLFEALDDSGLMFFSRLPFDEITEADKDCLGDNVDREVSGPDLDGKAVGFVPFDDLVGIGEDGWSRKGVGFARVIDPQTEMKYDIFFTHLQASYGKQSAQDRLLDSVVTRRSNMTQVADFIECIQASSNAEATVLGGDLNMNGDLSDPVFDFAGDECRLESGETCDNRDRLDDEDNVETCFDITETTQEICTISKDRRSFNRAEWDFFFNNVGGGALSFPAHAWRDNDLGMLDTWAHAMTPQCISPHGSPAICPPTVPTKTDPATGEAFTGVADFDRAFTNLNPNAEERLDYILMNGTRGAENRCAQHVTLAYNLWGGVVGDGGITPLGPEDLRGDQSISDHIGLNAEIDLDAAHCNPAGALVADALDDPGLEPTGDMQLRLPYRGAVHWIQIDQPGIWSFNVNPLFQNPPVEFDNGITYRVYEKTDLSRPLEAYHGEVWDVAPSEFCDVVNEDFICREVPGYREAKFHVVEPPIYVKVFHLGRSYPEDWNGYYRFLYRRALCTSKDEACGLAPFEGTETDANGDQMGTAAGVRTYPAGAGDPLWFSVNVDAPDGELPQSLKFKLTQKEVTDDPLLGAIRIVRASDESEVLALDAPMKDVNDRWVWEISDDTGLLDLSGNADGSEQKYFVKIERPPGSFPIDVDFWVHWETNLTWLYGTALGGRQAELHCDNSNDTFGDDEIYMQLIADGVRFPLGASSGEAPQGATVDSSFSDGQELEWVSTVMPRLGSNSHGRPFGDQMALKFVDTLTVELLEDDDTLNFQDDKATQTFQQLGPVVGSAHLPGKRFFGDEYEMRGGSLSHERPAKACNSSDECELPLACRAGFCRQSK